MRRRPFRAAPSGRLPRRRTGGRNDRPHGRRTVHNGDCGRDGRSDPLRRNAQRRDGRARIARLEKRRTSRLLVHAGRRGRVPAYRRKRERFRHDLRRRQKRIRRRICALRQRLCGRGRAERPAVYHGRRCALRNRGRRACSGRDDAQRAGGRRAASRMAGRFRQLSRGSVRRCPQHGGRLLLEFADLPHAERRTALLSDARAPERRGRRRPSAAYAHHRAGMADAGDRPRGQRAQRGRIPHLCR